MTRAARCGGWRWWSPTAATRCGICARCATSPRCSARSPRMRRRGGSSTRSASTGCSTACAGRGRWRVSARSGSARDRPGCWRSTSTPRWSRRTPTRDGATGTYKGGFGFHPLLAYLDTPDLPAGGMALAGRLRPGNAGANTASDHTRVVADALEQLPREVVENADILVRCDSAGATHELLDFCRDGALRFSVGFDLTEAVRRAILALGEQASTAALDQDATPRDNGHVAEITDHLDLCGWPHGSRVIVRRERPHPGAQLSFTDHDGHRFQAVLTDHPETDIAALERRHRARARVEDRIRAANDRGLTNLPFRDFDANAVWLELVLIAQDLVFYTQTLALDGELARCEPKRLRYRLLHCAGRLAFHARQAVLRLPRSWPWAGELAAAFARLAALPAR